MKPLAALTVSKYFCGQMLGKVFLLFQDSQIKIYITNSVFVGLRCMPLPHLKCRRCHFLSTRNKHPVITGSYRLFDGFLFRKKTFCKYQCTGVVYHGCSYKLESVSFGIIHKYAGLAYESPFVLLKVKIS